MIDALQTMASSGRTLIIATHHPALMQMANRVVRLHEGRVLDA